MKMALSKERLKGCSRAKQAAYISMSAKKTPVTIITGYLGAGKTTLLNHVLHHKGDKQLAVIENEFGEVKIDSSLVAANLTTGEDLVSLQGGCVCCSLRKDIVRALSELDARVKQRGKPFDSVLLETTGLADPAPVAYTFFSNPWIAARFKLDSILCVVDVAYTLKNLTLFEDMASPSETQTANECARQLAFSDLILLNKVDLVSPEELSTVRTIARHINRNASIIECQLNREDRCPSLDQIILVDTFSLKRALEIDPAFLNSESESDDSEDSDWQESCEQACDSGMSASTNFEKQEVKDENVSEGAGNISEGRKKEERNLKKRRSLSEVYQGERRRRDRRPKRQKKLMHDTVGISSVGITAKGALHQWRFNMFLRDFFAEKSNDIFRCKGVLCIKGMENIKFVFQGVHDNIVFGPSPDGWAEGEERMNSIVFIGKNLSRKALTSAFRTCVWTPLPSGWTEETTEDGKELLYVHESGIKQKDMPLVAVPKIVTSEVIFANHHKVMQQKAMKDVAQAH